MKTAWLVASLLLMALPASAGQFNPVLDIGDAAPAWQDLPGVDGRQHSLSDLKEVQVVVVVFTCNSCPYAVDAEDRLIALARKYDLPKVALAAINVNTIPEDDLEAMRRRAGEKQFPFPYLYDKTQQIARQYGANYTPEIFVLDQQRRIRYMGSLDDDPDGDAVQVRYVEQAIEALLRGGQPEVQETVPIGCRIRFQRTRR